jgi:hypothetical protein
MKSSAPFFSKILLLKPEKVFSVLGLILCIFSFSVILSRPVFASGVNGRRDMNVLGDSANTADNKSMSPVMQVFEVDNEGLFTPLDVSLDWVSVILMAIAAFLIVKSIREYGKSTIGIALIYFFNAVLVLGAIRILFILDDDGISLYTNVKDTTETVFWHTLFIYSMLLFYIAGRTLMMLVSSNKQKISYGSAIGYVIFSAIFSVAMIAIMPVPAVQDFWVAHLEGTWFDTFGRAHIISVFITGITAIYLFRIRDKFRGFTGIINGICSALGVLIVLHLWEGLNENWKVIVVSDNFGEFIERVLWIPVFIFILISFNQLRKITKVAPAATDENKMSVSPEVTSSPPVSPTPTSFGPTTTSPGESSFPASPTQSDESSFAPSPADSSKTEDTHQ